MVSHGTVPRLALVVVDFQRDFCDGGALAVRGADELLQPLNLLVRAFERARQPVFFTRDWHPPNHCSFRNYGGAWPPHCVVGTPGAQFHPLLEVPKDAFVISKATSADKDAYSGFQGTDLGRRLRRLGVRRVYVCGLATDYCVKNTVLDALALGFEVRLVADCIRGVNLKRTDSANAVRSMLSAGAKPVVAVRAAKSVGGDSAGGN